MTIREFHKRNLLRAKSLRYNSRMVLSIGVIMALFTGITMAINNHMVAVAILASSTILLISLGIVSMMRFLERIAPRIDRRQQPKK